MTRAAAAKNNPVRKALARWRRALKAYWDSPLFDGWDFAGPTPTADYEDRIPGKHIETVRTTLQKLARAARMLAKAAVEDLKMQDVQLLLTVERHADDAVNTLQLAVDLAGDLRLGEDLYVVMTKRVEVEILVEKIELLLAAKRGAKSGDKAKVKKPAGRSPEQQEKTQVRREKTRELWEKNYGDRKITALATKLGCNEATVRRDLKVLRHRE